MPKSNASVLFIFFALVGTLILSAAVLSLSLQGRMSVDDLAATVSSRDALPNDLTGVVNSLPILTAIVPTEAYSYWDESGPQLGLVQWDVRAGNWRLTNHVRLSGEPAFASAPDIALISPEWGNGLVLQLTGHAAGNVESVAFVRLVDNRLIQVPVDGGNGIRRLAYFEIGQVTDGESTLAVEDLDNDGKAEVVLTKSNHGSVTSVDVYFWTGDRLLRNGPMSSAMTAREGLFEE